MQNNLENQPEVNQLITLLYRHNYGKIVAVLTRIFGIEHIESAEDGVQDALTGTIKQWLFNGAPYNPTLWCINVAKSRTLSFIHCETDKKQYNPDLIHFLKSKIVADVPGLQNSFFAMGAENDYLKMIFICCHPCLSTNTRLILILKKICGFSSAEIGKSLLISEQNVQKQLQHGQHKIRERKIAFELPTGARLKKELATTLKTIYVLFNQGYNTSVNESIIRFELRTEAIRLAQIIATSPAIPGKSDTNELLAWMQLKAPQFESGADFDESMRISYTGNAKLFIIGKMRTKHR